MVRDSSVTLVYGKSKSAPRIGSNGLSSRRSSYTGVFKNGRNWQTLISIKKKKTYIGTFGSELEAAKTFDFFSIVVNGLTATTNFNYSAENVLEMIAAYRQYGNVLQ